ncbi:hypothetical protein D5086_026383 [Populus alba]|uniref:Uncharacterized protein n=1 Tax=Populus alba TaxID=43335 RepID=A0ACC4B268_POPAL
MINSILALLAIYSLQIQSYEHIWNTDEHEAVQALAITSRPPFKVFIYEDWFQPRTAEKLKLPVFWDDQCLQAPPKDEL